MNLSPLYTTCGYIDIVSLKRRVDRTWFLKDGKEAVAYQHRQLPDAGDGEQGADLTIPSCIHVQAAAATDPDLRLSYFQVMCLYADRFSS